MENNKKVSLTLRIGIAFVFIYAGILSILNPTAWLGFLPNFLQNSTLLLIFSIIEIILGGTLILNIKTKYTSILSGLIMLGIIVFNIGALEIVFRDVAIFLMAVALFLLEK